MNDLSLAAQLRNIEWELYVLYQSGDDVFDSAEVARLWSEVDRLDALLVLSDD